MAMNEERARDKPARRARGRQRRANGDIAFTGAIPEIYDRYLVPIFFESYAVHLATRVAACRPGDVLEVAARTGAVTRELARRLPESRIVATDLNQEMIDYASTRVNGDRIAWRQANAEALPFDDASFDAVVCQFGAMFFLHKLTAYREAKRVLRPGGAFLFSVWDRIEANGFAEEAMRGLSVLYPDDPPLFLLRTPHSYFDAGTIRSHLKEAGFTHVTIAAVEHHSTARNPRDVAIALCLGTPIKGEIEARGIDREAAIDAVAAAIARRFGVGEVEGNIRALVVEGR
jgi:SAM-dependent methyltransferase